MYACLRLLEVVLGVESLWLGEELCSSVYLGFWWAILKIDLVLRNGERVQETLRSRVLIYLVFLYSAADARNE